MICSYRIQSKTKYNKNNSTCHVAMISDPHKLWLDQALRFPIITEIIFKCVIFSARWYILKALSMRAMQTRYISVQSCQIREILHKRKYFYWKSKNTCLYVFLREAPQLLVNSTVLLYFFSLKNISEKLIFMFY